MMNLNEALVLATATTMTDNPFMMLLRFVLGMAAVFFLMWLLYKWFRKTNLGDYEGPGLRIVSRVPLSRSAQVAVVEIGGRMFLVGAGDSAVTPIAELYDTEEMAFELDTAAASFGLNADNAPVRKPFGQVLAKFSKQAENVTAETAAKASGTGSQGSGFGSNLDKDTPAPIKPVKRMPRPVVKARPAVLAAEPVSVKKPMQVAPAGTGEAKVTEAQMDALAAQIAAEFGVKKPGADS